MWCEGTEIRPATVTSLDKDAEILKEIDGLPKGLIFDGKTISGIPEQAMKVGQKTAVDLKQ